MKDHMFDVNENCWQTGSYTDECDCNVCPHNYECSGAGEDRD